MKPEIPTALLAAASEALRATGPGFTLESVSKAVLEAACVGEMCELLIELRHSLSPAYRLSPEGRAYIEKINAIVSKYE